MLDTFYGDFSGKLNRAQAEKGGMRPNVPTNTDIPCSVCGRPMQVRTGSTGVFLGCSGYALPPKERCTHTLNLIPGDEVVDVDADAEGESRLLRTKVRCPRCRTPMDSYLVDEGRRLHICGNNPDCPGFRVEQGEFRIKGYDGPVIECDKCGAEMQLKSGRFGKYFGCTNTNCKNTRKLLRNGEAAPPKSDPVPMPELRCVKVEDHYILRDGASGIFLAASQFPKHRETRAPTIAELKPHRAEIDPKHRYLLDAPETDPHGNPAIVKYSRKTREQFVASDRTASRRVGARYTRTVAGCRSRARARKPSRRGRRVPEKKDCGQTCAAQARAELIIGAAMDEQSDAFSMLEIVQIVQRRHRAARSGPRRRTAIADSVFPRGPHDARCRCDAGGEADDRSRCVADVGSGRGQRSVGRDARHRSLKRQWRRITPTLNPSIAKV